ncbi:MAG: hypothetical protein JW757_10055 [Anaerolineales bacterium]|nr:hypothetical protein [Anaerolineales bacterium]
MVSNPGKMLFPAKDNFDAEMTLWTAGGEPRARIEAHTIQAISPDETIQLASSSWKLDPGVYFLTWGSPEYGGNVTIFSIVEDAGRIYRANSVSFSTKPPEYNIQASSAGRIRSFSVEADGTLIITGETPVPDTHCVFPILFDGTGVVEGFPVGTCAQIAEGQWQMTHPTDPSGIKVQVKKDTSYQVIVFCEDLTLPPSEPFAVHISPPPQN